MCELYMPCGMNKIIYYIYSQRRGEPIKTMKIKKIMSPHIPAARPFREIKKIIQAITCGAIVLLLWLKCVFFYLHHIRMRICKNGVDFMCVIQATCAGLNFQRQICNKYLLNKSRMQIKVRAAPLISEINPNRVIRKRLVNLLSKITLVLNDDNSGGGDKCVSQMWHMHIWI